MNGPVATFPEFENRVVLITGGSSGIGASLVEAFAASRAKVAFIDIDEAAGRSLVDDLEIRGHGRPMFVKADLTDIEQLRAAIALVADRLGDVGVLINNAARDDRLDFDTLSEEDWDGSQAVNLRPVFFATQAVAPMMRKAGGGAIVNFSSIAFLLNMPDLPAYVAAKAGIVGLTKSLAGKLGPDNIRVNAILPGMVLTERQKKLWIKPEDVQAMIKRQCLKFSLTPPDLTGPCLFLASDAARAVTAQTLIVDGGCL